jgi:hypothetical protein
MANKYNKNKDADADTADAKHNVDFDDYNEKLKLVLAMDKPGLKWKEAKINRQIERAEDNDKAIILKKDGNKYVVSRITKIAFAKHDLEADEDESKGPAYVDIVDDILKQKADQANAAAAKQKAEADTRARANEWIEACRNYVKRLPSSDITNGMNPRVGYDFVCKANFGLVDCVNRRRIATVYLPANGEIDSDA